MTKICPKNVITNNRSPVGGGGVTGQGYKVKWHVFQEISSLQKVGQEIRKVGQEI